MLPPFIVDPSNELDWYSLAVGFALYAGYTPNRAHEFACHTRYHREDTP